MAKKKTTVYNKQAVYKKKIAPIVEELKQTCMIERLPMFVAVAVANNEQQTSFMKTIVHGGTGVILNDDRISDIILHLNSFQMEHPKEIQELLEKLEKYINTIASNGNPDIPQVTDNLINDLERIVGSEKPQKFHFMNMNTEDDFHEIGGKTDDDPSGI